MITGASAEGMVMLVIETLDGATVECAAALVACEQAARRVRPELERHQYGARYSSAGLPSDL
jgi:hypothetical protein